ncbi:helix-loop-helix dna-binding domain-containing protein [Moniliophthora roreri]|nr:helix-loop-helix dna-binding domain-containing protein [Moniliophthora roreri]
MEAQNAIDIWIQRAINFVVLDCWLEQSITVLLETMPVSYTLSWIMPTMPRRLTRAASPLDFDSLCMIPQERSTLNIEARLRWAFAIDISTTSRASSVPPETRPPHISKRVVNVFDNEYDRDEWHESLRAVRLKKEDIRALLNPWRCFIMTAVNVDLLRRAGQRGQSVVVRRDIFKR